MTMVIHCLTGLQILMFCHPSPCVSSSSDKPLPMMAPRTAPIIAPIGVKNKPMMPPMMSPAQNLLRDLAISFTFDFGSIKPPMFAM